MTTTTTKPRYCHACEKPTGTVPLFNGECAECHEALKAHRYWTTGEGANMPPPKESPVITRGRRLGRNSPTERFTESDMKAVYAALGGES